MAKDCRALCRRAAQNEIDRNASPLFAQHDDEILAARHTANFRPSRVFDRAVEFFNDAICDASRVKMASISPLLER